MNAVEFIKEYSRLCNTYKNCTECPFRESPCGTDCDWTLGLEEEIVEIVEQWSQSHPQKTMIQDFFEKFPNAPRTVDGLPFPCPFECGYSKNNNCPFGKNNPSDDCSKCWFRPLEES